MSWREWGTLTDCNTMHRTDCSASSARAAMAASVLATFEAGALPFFDTVPMLLRLVLSRPMDLVEGLPNAGVGAGGGAELEAARLGDATAGDEVWSRHNDCSTHGTKHVSNRTARS